MRLTSIKASPDSEGKSLKGQGRHLEFKTNRTKLNKIIQFSLDPQAGILYAIKEDQSILTAEGFLTQDSLGRGRRGKKGRQGKPGINGHDGREGKPGKAGCKGPVGLKGDKGIAGLDAEDGPTGIEGRQGCPGIPGEQGDVGDVGDKGHQGEIGLKGISCIVGHIGPYGPDGNGNCVVQSTAPVYAYIWGDTSPNPTAEVPAAGDKSFNVSAINQPLVLKTGNKYASVASSVATDFNNIERFKISWSGSYEDEPRIKPTVSVDTQTLTLEASATIQPSKSLELIGTIIATLTDLDTNETVQVSTQYRFKATNSATLPQEVYGIISEDQTVTGGDSTTFTLTTTNSKGSTIPVEEDTEIRFGFSGSTSYLTSGIEVTRVIKAGESQTSIPVATLDAGTSIRNVVVQARGIGSVTGDSLTSNLAIKPKQVTQSRELIVPSTIKLQEAEAHKPDTYNLKVQLKTPFTGNETGAITLKLVSGTALVGQLAEGSGSTLVVVESLTRRLVFDATTTTITVPIKHIGDNFRTGNRKFTIQFSDGDNITEPPAIVADVIDNERLIGGIGGGGGCIARTSLIDTPNGKVQADLLTVGDYVTSQTGINDIDQDYDNFELNKVNARIEQIKLDTYHKYLVIEGLAVTHDHPIFVLNKTFKWLRADKVSVGDLIYKNGSWIPVSEIVERFEEFEVVNFNVEPDDVYYANGILVHNSELNFLGQQMKR